MTDSQQPLRGIVPPMPTPLLSRDELDVGGLERLIEHLIGGGVHGIFILGSTGEGPSLSAKVQRDLITRSCKLARSRVPVLVGITDTSFTDSLAIARHAADNGVFCTVFAPPYYFPLNQEELLGYTRRLLAELPLPAMLYNMPRMTKLSFEPATIEKLTDHRKIIGIKDSGGDLDYFRKIIEVARARPDWSVFVGPERLLVDTIRLGGAGGVNGGGNVWPRLLVDLYEAAVKKDEAKIASLQPKLSQLGQIYNAVQQASNLVKGLKCALSLMGICSTAVAEPFTPSSPAECDRARNILTELGLLR